MSREAKFYYNDFGQVTAAVGLTELLARSLIVSSKASNNPLGLSP